MASCSFVDLNVSRRTEVKKHYGPLPKRDRQVQKCCSLYNVLVDNINTTNQSGQKVKETWMRQLVSTFSHYPVKCKWLQPVCVRVLFLMCLCCMLSRDVSSASITFPHGCVCSNASAREHSALVSVNCSNLGFLHYILDFNAAKEYNTTNTNLTTTSDKDQESANQAPRLYYLDLSCNKLTSVKPNIQGYESSLNNMFQIQVNILIFSFNNITQVQASDLSAYTGIKNLDLSYNLIQLMDANAFEGMETISSLNLSHNSIEDFANSTIQTLENLRILDLSYNNLFVFSFSKLPVLSSLQYLYLNNNKLRSVTSSSSNLTLLVFLNLSNNQLKELPSGMFEFLSSLKILNMANCLVQEVNEYFLKGLHSLEDLTLDQNDILAIRKPVFQNTSLVRLSIAAMPSLSNISHDAFLGLSNLLFLNLSHNPQLSFLQPNLLTPLASLQILDVSNSSLTQLSEITFHKNKNLREVYLLNNPLWCSCTNAWLAKEASDNHTKLVNAYSLYCLSDPEVQTDINNASFNCEKISIHNISTRISAKLGTQLLLKCQNQSENPAVVMWTTPSGNTFYQHHFHPDASQHLLTPEDIQPGSEFHNGHYWHYTSSYHSEVSSSAERVLILSDGSLYIDYMMKLDAGPYICKVSNAEYKHTVTIKLYVDCTLSSDVKLFGCLVGLLCALTFFTLNLIYVIISWTARQLVNKRRREIIGQMLENMNAYKSTQIARIHENYTHQLNRVRTQYHNQCDRLQRNYTSQVTKMKRGCSNQVERVRENYNIRLTQLRDYSSNQIMQIRERANCQIVRIRDYSTNQLDKLRETYKFQQLHVLKLLDTMNLDNCRNIVETECMRAESMMYDIDLLGDDERTDSPTSPGDSEYSTAASSPSSSLDDPETAGLRRDLSQKNRELSTDSSECSGVIVQVQTTIDLEVGLPVDAADTWTYGVDNHFDLDSSHEYLMDMDNHNDPSLVQFQNDPTLLATTSHPRKAKPGVPLPTLSLIQKRLRADVFEEISLAQGHSRSDSDSSNCDGLYMTPEASPTKVWSEPKSLSAFGQNDRTGRPRRNQQGCDIIFSDDTNSISNETNV